MYTTKTLNVSKRAFLIYSLGVFSVSIIVWNLVRYAVNFTMTIKNSAIRSVRKLERKFCKIGLVTLFSITILLIFGLVAPKVNAYDETIFTSISYGKSPSYLIEWARTFTSDSRKDYDNNIVYVYTYNSQCYAYVYFLDDSITSINCPTNRWGNPSSNVNAFCVQFVYDRNLYVTSYGSGGRTIYFDGENNHISPNYGNIWTNKITLTFDNGSVTPPISFIDGYSVTPRGWTFSYNVYPLPTSEHIAWYYQTRRYIVRITATFNGQPITLDVPNYLSWTPSTKINPVVEPFNKTENGQLIPVFQITTTGADKSVETYYQNVMYYRFDTNDDNISFITMSQPDVDYTDNNSSHWVDTSTVEMTLSLYNLLNAFRDAYPNNTFADNWLYQDFSLSFIGYDDNKTYYTQVLPYAVVSDKTDAPPDVDTNQNNWFDNRQTIIDNINNNQTYDFLSNPPARWSSPLSLNSLDSITSIDSPDYSFPDISNLDGSATDFFSWLVNLVISSPIGLLILIGLGFLVVKAVVHQ